MREKRRKCTLCVLLIAPDKELAKEDATYVQLNIGLYLPFTPFPELKISVPDLILENHPEAEYFLALSEIAPQVSSHFTVKEIRYCTKYDEFTLYAENEFYPTLEQFKAAQLLYIRSYGFTRSVNGEVIS